MRMYEKYSSSSSYFFGVIATIGGALSLDQWAIVIGIVCTLGTFLVNWYYKRKEFQLKSENRNEKS